MIILLSVDVFKQKHYPYPLPPADNFEIMYILKASGLILESIFLRNTQVHLFNVTCISNLLWNEKN